MFIPTVLMIWSSWTANLVNRIQNFSSLPNFWNLDSSDMLKIVSQINSNFILLSPLVASLVHHRQKFHSLLVQSCLLGGSKSPSSLPRSLWQPKRSQRRHQVVPNGTPSCPKEATKWSPRFPQTSFDHHFHFQNIHLTAVTILIDIWNDIDC